MSKIGKNRLGRGLNSLLGNDYTNIDSFIETNENITEENKIFLLNINDVVRNSENPRYNFDKQELEKLTLSIKEHGVLQPIIVKPNQNNKYTIIAGERRWRASKTAGLTNIPAIIKNIDEQTSLELAIIENIQRADLSPIEEALGYKQLLELYGYSQEDLANKVGFSRSHITNMVRLLSLPEPVKQLLEEKKISTGHARCLINNTEAISLALKVVKNKLSVRQLEELIKKPTKNKVKIDNVAWQELEKNLSTLIKLNVKIKKQSRGGQLIIKYNNEDELLRFLEKIKN